MTKRINAFANNLCFKIHRNNVNSVMLIKTVNNAQTKIIARFVIQIKSGLNKLFKVNAYAKMAINNGTTNAYYVK